jgi:putative flippase GtrA
MRKGIDSFVISRKRGDLLADLIALARTFSKFAAVGLFVTVFNFAVFFLLVFAGAHYTVAAVGGWLPSVTIAYFLNRGATFNVENNARLDEFFNYCKANVLQLLLSLIVIAVLVDGFSVSLEIAALCNLVVLPVSNFVILRCFVFPNARPLKHGVSLKN